ncbi:MULTISPECIES: SPOR domain-containing protein [Aeromonas]|uniref:Cell division protein n=1 Tax=Aeromonas media TaxID=651 RepID=A0AAE7DRC0_AERME|nr:MULTISPECIES: SPOR domain-containing protein [Aeromonas]MBV7471271.1 SPOR domain-containing protein [Aeromonas sp. sif0611]MCV3287579.1 SPOR domain-containing protein [Aeromonas media]MDM5078083.1 SPOR domain-containing protein [Aeromonas media]QJT32429.1 cell division protein [Aeromonas media]QJT33090.1 cell division protein [Aeromonas media]
MATRDYVSNSPRRRAGGRNIKKAAPRRFPVIPALLAGALVVGFGAFLYLINGKGADAPTIEEQVKANKPKAQGNTLPQEKWSYIERLENKQVDIIEPPPQPGVLPPPPAETLTLQPEKLPQPVPTEIPQPGTPIGQVKPFQPQPVQPAKPATGAPVASAQEQVINQKAERERMEREIRAELERERAEAARAKAATQTAAADGGRYMMQCAALRSQDSAESLKARIAFGAGLSSSLQVVNGANGTVYKVMVGPFSGKAAVDAANRKLQGSGISGCIPKKG